MPELLIKYKNPKVKEALRDFSKYLYFSIVQPSSKKAAKKIKRRMIIFMDKLKKAWQK